MTDKKIALIIGNDNYHSSGKLTTAVSDARDMTLLLKTHEDGQTNFRIQSPGENVSNQYIKDQITQLLSREEALEYALFYFSGHGLSDESGSYICGVDTDLKNQEKGVPFSWIAKKINASGIPEVTVIFDCCYAGGMFNCPKLERELSVLRRGVTFLGATMRNDLSQGAGFNGKFTSILIDGLKGSTKDLFGNVSALSLYQLADSMLSASQQRPVLKSSVKQISLIRKCHPLMSIPELKRLITPPFFEHIDFVVTVNPKIIEKKQSARYMNYDELLLFAKYDKLGLLDSENGNSLVQVESKWIRFHLSSFGKNIWHRIKHELF